MAKVEYDRQRKKRFKTVELIVAECDWEPRAPRFADDAVVGIRVGIAERQIQQQVRQAGGKWNRRRQVWELRYDRVVRLKLEARIVEEMVS